MSKLLKILILSLVLSTLAFTSAHKYYVSITQIEYVEEKQSLQVITRIFIDDLERLIRERYDETITLAGKDEPKIVDSYIERYLKDKIRIKINGSEPSLDFLGKEYDDNLIYCYLEIQSIETISSFEITNQVLFDVFSEQKNVIRTKINSKNKSFILVKENDKGLLNFN